MRWLNRPAVLHDIDFDIRAGGILGICGMTGGSGRTELMRALMGADASSCASTGSMAPNAGRPVRARRSPAASVLLPEDRKTEGCFLPQSVAFNITISRPRNELLSESRERDIVQNLVRKLGVRAPGPDSLIRNLSGGNQQKCLIARSLNAGCAILLIDEPTRGVDVGAKREIYQLLASLADEQGAATVIVSSELPESLGLCDRIVVMRDGGSPGGSTAARRPRKSS